MKLKRKWDSRKFPKGSHDPEVTSSTSGVKKKKKKKKEWPVENAEKLKNERYLGHVHDDIGGGEMR